MIPNIVFLVRKNNPLNIKDWSNLIKNHVKIIIANPKTSGGAIWGYLSAVLYAKRAFRNDQEQVLRFLKILYKNVPVMSNTNRSATAIIEVMC